MRSTLLALVAISAAAIYACGGNAPEAQPPTSTADAAAPETPSTASTAPATPDTATAATTPPPAETKPEGGFDSLPKDKKLDIMMSKVVPDVGKVFKDKDAKKYAKFGCKTCHGDAKEKSKDDSKKVLPKLALSNGGMEKLQKAKPEMVKFMQEKVTPAMVAALGEKPYDMQTHTGFGCGGCHAVD